VLLLQGRRALLVSRLAPRDDLARPAQRGGLIGVADLALVVLLVLLVALARVRVALVVVLLLLDDVVRRARVAAVVDPLDDVEVAALGRVVEARRARAVLGGNAARREV